MAKGDPAAFQVIGRELYRDGVALNDLDEELAHFASDVRQYHMLVFEAHSEERIRQNFDYSASQFDCIRFGRLLWSRGRPPPGPPSALLCPYHSRHHRARRAPLLGGKGTFLLCAL